MRRIFITHDPIETTAITDLLQRAGIATEIRDETDFAIHTSPQNHTKSLSSLWTADEKAQHALDIIAEYLRNIVRGVGL